MFRFVSAIFALVQIVISTNIAAPLATCDEAGLRAAIDQGGVITFPCDTTITISSTITISNQVTLDATGRAVTLAGNNSVRLFQIAPGSSLDLIHLTLADGSAIKGGAILNDNGRVFTANCLFQNNRATGSVPDLPAEGGAIYSAGELTVTNCEFRANVAAVDFQASTNQPGVTAEGGAIKSTGSLSVDKSSFLSNSASGGKGGDGSLSDYRLDIGGAGGAAGGAAIYVNSGSHIVACVFSNNIVRGGIGGKGSSPFGLSGGISGIGGAAHGSAVLVDSTTSASTVTASTFISNSGFGGAGGAPGGFGVGGAAGGTAAGAVYLLSGTLNLANSAWLQNQSYGGAGATNGADSFVSGLGGGTGGLAAGAAVFAEAGFLFATNDTFFANTASGGPGGFTTLSTLPGGSGGDAFGAAIFVKSATARIAHATLSLNNVVPGPGALSITLGGLGNFSSRGNADGAGIKNQNGTVFLANSILATNYATLSVSVPSANCSGAITDLGFNISSDWSFPFVMSGIDPKLGAFDFNGGPTKNFALLPDSPAIDFSNPANSPPTDQRGFSRSAGHAPDAGAYESDLIPALDLDLAKLKSQIANGGTVIIDKPGVFMVSQTLEITKKTTIDASHAPVVFDGGGGTRLFHVSSGIGLTLVNATIANGRAVEGAGLFNDGGFVTLIGCTFSNNVAVGWSGAPGTNSASKHTGGGSGGNGSLGRGGAILNMGGILVVSNSFFIANSAHGGRGGDGGIGGDGSYILLQGYACRPGSNGGSGGQGGVGGNSQGGAIWNSWMLNLVNSVFRDNQVAGGLGGTGGRPGAPPCSGGLDPAGSGGSGGDAEGGAIFSTKPFQISRSALISNNAIGGAGGKGGDFPSYAFASAVGGAGGQGANGYAGAIASQSANITNVTFGFNIAVGGTGGPGGSACSSTNGAGGNAFAGAIDEGQTNIAQNCTFVGNAVYPGPGGTLTNYCNRPTGPNGTALAATIRARNSPVVARQEMTGSIIVCSDAQASVIGKLVDHGYNLSNDPQLAFTAATSKRNIDPLLLSLDDSGDLPFFRPALNSPARDAMPSSIAPTVDQRGVLRPIGPAADIGAIEIAMPEIPPLIALNPNGTLSLTFTGHPDSDYLLFESSTLDSWTPISANRASADGSLLFGPIDASAPQKFFLSTGP